MPSSARYTANDFQPVANAVAIWAIDQLMIESVNPSLIFSQSMIRPEIGIIMR